VKRVFIMEDCAELMPEYLRFVKGVVDAADLSLNVSREILQQDRQIQLMRRRLVKKVLSSIKSLMGTRPDDYAKLWGEVGAALKEGLLSDSDNRDAILEVCSFASTHSDESLTTLAEYVSRMKEGQEHIYFMTGDSRVAVEKSPHLEALRAKDYEVLILTDTIDEMWVDSVPAFDGKTFQSVAKGQVDLETDEEKSANEAKAAEFGDLLTWMKEQLEDSVKEVRLSSRLTTSPACVVGDSYDITPTLEKMYKAMGQELPKIKRILELNPSHPLVEGLQRAFAAGERDGLADTAELIHGLALLAEGGELADPSRFVKLVADRVQRTF
jgi:molecular chaperone HtpG